MRPNLVGTTLALCALQLGAQSSPSREAYVAAIARVPAERMLADSALRIVNLYRTQADILLARKINGDSATVEALVERTYRSYERFWSGYLGDEVRFRKFASKLLIANDSLVLARLRPAFDLPIDSMFVAASEWVVRTTRLKPRGTWYLAFAHGATDMGGVGDIGMVLDFNAQMPEAAGLRDLFPHELIHMVSGPDRANDPAQGSVLDRIIGEGIACYAAWVAAGGRLSPAQATLGSTAEWDSAVAHERELQIAAKEILTSRSNADLDRVASRDQRLIPNGPSAAGYFIGFRIAEAWEKKFGRGSWTQILSLMRNDVLRRSGYGMTPS